MSDALERLAHIAGIQPAFRDYFGNETTVSDATTLALLSAMGYDVASDARIEVTLLAAQDESWLRVLPPVSVVPAGDGVHVDCTLPANAGGSLEWAIAFEDGTELRGVSPWADAAMLDEHAIGERRFERRRLHLGGFVPPGYHRVAVWRGDAVGDGSLIAVPDACYVTPAMERGRVWALATQLYALRSRNNWGIGDFSDLAGLAAIAAEAGARCIALNPLHELYPGNPRAASPYAPSSRLFLNTVYLDVSAVPDLAESPQAHAIVAAPEFVGTLESLRATELVDYAGVAAAKRRILELLYEAFCANHLERPGDARAARFRAFVRAGGRDLERLAIYEALAEHFRARDGASHGWLQWPIEYRSPQSPEVARFAREHRYRIDFYAYLQWLADEQLARAATIARGCGLGLYRDLAVGVDRNGADAWGDPGAIVADASLGTPADPLNTNGQQWGLPPLSPRILRERAYAPFVALLRANMRHASILRIDHAMALRRAFWIPRGRPATEGAYVSYPFDDMLGILALESVRNRCAVVGEDLGTVPEGFRERLQAARALSSRLVYFEREWDGTFRSARDYPRVAAASIGTHDLPPLLGWWTAAAGDGERRARFMLVDALLRDACIDEAGAHRLREDAARGGTIAVANELSLAVHRFLAQSPSMLAIVAIEDVLGETAGVNVPGTVDEHPNWRRKRSLPLEALGHDGRLFAIGALFDGT